MAFCTECGTQLPAGARFCPGCGASATPGETVAQPTREPLPGDLPPPAAAASYSAPPASAPPRPTSYDQPIQSGGGSAVAWIVPLLIVIAALAIGYTLFAPGRDGPSTKPTETASGEKAGDKAGEEPASEEKASEAAGSAEESAAASAPSDAGARSVDQAAAAAERLSSGGGVAVSAAQIDAAFNRDPDGAGTIYGGPVRVSGVIASMVQPGRTPALSMEGRTRFNYMIVNFPAGYRERLAPLAKGQFIQVACGRARGFAGTTILEGCDLE
jgi:hypothetical protein